MIVSQLYLHNKGREVLSGDQVIERCARFCVKLRRNNWKVDVQLSLMAIIQLLQTYRHHMKDVHDLSNKQIKHGISLDHLAATRASGHGSSIEGTSDQRLLLLVP